MIRKFIKWLLLPVVVEIINERTTGSITPEVNEKAVRLSIKMRDSISIEQRESLEKI